MRNLDVNFAFFEDFHDFAIAHSLEIEFFFIERDWKVLDSDIVFLIELE